MPMARVLVAVGISCLSFNVGHAQMIIAHRGASYVAPENTLAAFREAWRQQADGIEGDFYYTRDKHVVCIHDTTTRRTAGEDLSVPDSSLAELQQLEYGGWKADKYRGEPLPTLPEVIACIPPSKTFVIELKTGPAIVPLVQQHLEDSGFDHRQVLIISFDADTIRRSKQLMPEVRAHWLTGYRQNEDTGTWSPTASRVAQTLQACGADGLGTQANRAVVTSEFIDRLRQSGLREFHVWTVDRPQDAVYFRDLGAMAITTNRPAVIRDALSE